MGIAGKEFAGQADGKTISGIVKKFVIIKFCQFNGGDLRGKMVLIKPHFDLGPFGHKGVKVNGFRIRELSIWGLPG